jgi:D-3-phosphoglycerate dehydrogenase
MKIVLAEKVSPATLAVLREEPTFTIITADEVRPADQGGLAAEIADADGLVVRSAVQVNAALLEHAKQLRVIGRAGVGVDNIDADAATRKGIVVMNTPGANAIAVAELSIGLMIALARQLPKANISMHAGRWEKKSLEGRELRGKTLGILGLGRIGQEVARRARIFGMELAAYDPFISPALARENGVRLVELEELWTISDFLSLHVGLSPQTHGIINSATIQKMKPGVRIINCARGELIVDADLVAAIKSGQVAGAALDVFHQEPLKDSAFTAFENVILTPHIAGSTRESQEAVGIQIARQVRDYLKLGIAQNAVNLPSLTHEEFLVIAPYLDMAERLGSFLGQVTDGNVESVQIAYNGSLAAQKTELVRSAAIAGILGTSQSVNRINAAAIAERRGIRISEDKNETGAPALVLTLHTQTGARSATGTVLHGNSPRLLNAHGIDVEAPLHGRLLCIRNQDVPGVIGRVGTLLAEHGINIANFALGRPRVGVQATPSAEAAPQGQAFAVVQVEGAITPDLLVQLRKQPAIISARLVDLPE